MRCGLNPSGCVCITPTIDHTTFPDYALDYAPETVHGPILTIPKISTAPIVPPPLADYFMELLKQNNPIFPITFNHDGEKIDYTVREAAQWIWEEHVANTFKCPKGHKVNISGDYDGSIYVYCDENDCFFAKNDLNL